MSASLHERCSHMILGALVADAASMGLHWIYDQDRIRAVAPQTPEFTGPDAAHFEGVPAFFAHGARRTGDCSQYGEQAAVMLDALAAQKGRFDPSMFAARFRAHFGYGGGYVGYIDHATRDTLDNYRRFEDAAQAVAAAIPFDGSAKTTKAIVAKALPVLARTQGGARSAALEAEVAGSIDDPAVAAHARAICAALGDLPMPTGASDLQLPATAKLPALIAALCAQTGGTGPAFDDAVAAAVRVTSDHPTAAAYGHITAHLMAGALLHGTVEAALDAARAAAAAPEAELLETALAMKDQDNSAATAHFGMACDLPYGVPSVVHNINTADSFTSAVRRNIYAGGDTCGRAIILGAVMGAVHGIGTDAGIPQQWIDRLNMRENVMPQLKALFG